MKRRLDAVLAIFFIAEEEWWLWLRILIPSYSPQQLLLTMSFFSGASQPRRFVDREV